MFITQTQTLSPLKRLERAHVELMSHPETMEYAGVILVGKYEVRKDVPTARTNGVDAQYGEAFIAGLSESDLRGLIIHENLHKVFQHTFLWKHLYEIDAKRANKACDYVINLIIKDIDRRSNGFVTLPKGGLYDEKYRGMSSQEVFDALADESGDEGEGGEGGEGGGEGGGDGDGAGLDEHDWDTGDLTPEDVESVKREIDQAIRQGQLMAGKMGGNKSQALADVTEPKVDWREQLREFLSAFAAGKDISTWQRVNRRWLQHDVYMPSTVSETVGRIAVAADTSGSVFSAMGPFLAEMQAIAMTLKPEKVDVLYWDTDVTRHEMYGQDHLDKLAGSTKPLGGGGTDVRCVPKYLKANQIKPECVVVLTDGEVYGGWGEWDCPVLWCIVGDCKAVPSVGKVIYVDL